MAWSKILSGPRSISTAFVPVTGSQHSQAPGQKETAALPRKRRNNAPRGVGVSSLGLCLPLQQMQVE